MRDSRLILRTVGYAMFGAIVVACASGCTSSSNDAATATTDINGGTVIPGTGPVGGVVVPPGTKCAKDLECGNGRCVEGACVPGSACVDDTTCNGGHCVQGGCVPATATDGVKNGDETGIDCGGSVAPRCADGLACVVGPDCVSKVCTGGVCQAPTATDGVQNGDESAIDCGGTTAPKCAPGLTCKVASDCDSGICGPDGTCTAPTNSDGVKNGTETDIDCGGGAPTNAPMCATGKGCAATTDCVWGHCDANVCGGHVPGTKDGDETDINCGGKMSPACDWYLSCLVNTDCGSGICDDTNHCAVGASCKGGVHGISTCGIGEFNDGFKTHETCCKSLPVAAYSDPNQVGKTVYVDKYEITAGRMRAFVNAIAAANGGTPNIKAWVTANPPARWNDGWTNFLPQGNEGSISNFTVTNPTGANLLNPGQDQYTLVTHPTQGTWSVGSGNFAVDMGVFYSFGGIHLFPEYITGAGWPTPDYAAAHALNCGNGAGQEGWSTYWFDAATIARTTGGVGKIYSQDVLDEKSMNCSPSSVFAAFCAWDGGQLATAEVLDNISGNTVQPIYDGTYPNGKYASQGGNSNCGPGGNTLNTFSDGTQGCYNLPNQAGYYPGIDNSYDASAKITSPGRVAADTMTKNAGDEPWMDMVGNLEEIVMKRGETIRFDYRGYGAEYGSITHHRNQESTPRYKSGAMGARCMRFK